MSTITEEKENNEEQRNTGEVDEESIKMAKSSAFNQYYTSDSSNLFDEFVEGTKPSLRNLFNKKIKREDKLRISRNFVWNLGLLYRIIKIKTDYISSGFEIYSDDEDVMEFYSELNEQVDIQRYIENAAFEHEVIGEWYPYLSWSGDDLNKLTILDPKQIDIKSIFGEDVIELSPPKEVRNILNRRDGDPVKDRLQKIIPRRYLEDWKSGRSVVLEEDEVFRYFNTKAYHEKYAHTPIEPIFDDLALLSMHKESDYSISYKIKKAILQVKIGDENYKDGKPVSEDTIDSAMEMFRNPSESMEVFTQWFMNADWIIPDPAVYAPEKYRPVIRNILQWSGLEVMVNTESRSTTGDGQVKAEGFYRDVQSARRKIKISIEDIFETIARKKGFTTYGNNLKLPEIEFSNDVFMSNDELLETVQYLYKHGLISPDTALEKFGINFNREVKKKEGKMDTYREYIKVPFEPSQDGSMRSFDRLDKKHEQEKELLELEQTGFADEGGNEDNNDEE